LSNLSSGLVIDVRGLTPAHRRPLIFSIIDKLLEMDCTDSIVPAGLGYQIELRRETKGKFEFDYDKRLDGAWVGLIRRRCF